MVAGLGQMTLTAIVGYAVTLALGMTPMTAFYVAAALTFSSTVIIVKLLSDKREIDAPHGRIALGILIMQDIVVVILMIGLASLGTELGFSKEVGAFVAGVALAATPYKAILAARLVSLRDFLLLFFFIDLGVQINMGHFGAALGPAILLSVIVLVGKPIMVMALVGSMRYSKHTAVTTGLTMGQISEFSLILAALGLSLGHIDRPTMGLITLIGLITFGLSSNTFRRRTSK